MMANDFNGSSTSSDGVPRRGAIGSGLLYEVGRSSVYDTPLSGSSVYSYDRDRRLTRITFSSSKRITRNYEDVQLRSIITPQYTVSYTYEPCGSTVKSLTTGTETITYGHDGPLVTSAAQHA